MKINQPNTVYRVSIFNQIYYSKYYHVQGYTKNPKTNKFKADGPCYGHRGLGGNLGMNWNAAQELAQNLNKEFGWTSNSDKSNLYFELYC